MLEHGSYYSPSGDLRIDVVDTAMVREQADHVGVQVYQMDGESWSRYRSYEKVGELISVSPQDAAALVAGFARREQA